MSTEFERALYEFLRPGKQERFALPESCVALLGACLERALAGPAARAEVERALQLMVAMRSKLDSPLVAVALAELLRASPLARPHLEALGATRGFELQARDFARSEGRDPAFRAPKASGPRNGARGLQVKDFLTPGQQGPKRRS